VCSGVRTILPAEGSLYRARMPVEFKRRESVEETAGHHTEGAPTQGEQRRLVEAIKSKIHEYITETGASFVDRVEEVEKILGVSAVIRWGEVTVLYGPKGCGKTTFFKALAWAAHELDLYSRGYRVFLAEYVEEKGVVSISGPEGVMKKFKDTLAKIFGQAEVGITAGAAGVVPFLTIKVGSRPAHSPNPHVSLVVDLLEEIARDPEEGSYILVADEYRISDIERLRSSLETLPNYLYTISDVVRKKLRGKSSSISLVITTSDAVVAKLTAPVGDKVGWLYMWNLPRDAAEDYAEQLGLFKRAPGELGIRREEARELLWRLAGGNPRNLRIMAREGVMSWLGSITAEVTDIVDTLEGRLGGRLWSALGEVLDSVDSISRHEDLYNSFLSANIAIRMIRAKPISPLPREPWVGERYAFQIPGYYYTIKAIHRKRSTKVTPRDVLEEASRGA